MRSIPAWDPPACGWPFFTCPGLPGGGPRPEESGMGGTGLGGGDDPRLDGVAFRLEA